MQKATVTRPSSFPPAMFLALLGAALAIFGTVSPWARVPGYASTYGLPGGEADVFWVIGTEAPGMIPLVGDGKIILALTAVAGLLILWRLVYPPRSCGFLLLAVFTLLALSAFIGSVNFFNAGHIPRPDSTRFFASSVEVSWGLIVLCIGAWVGTLAAGYQLWRDELR